MGEPRSESGGVQRKIEGLLEMTPTDARICEYGKFEYVL
jgi:hypothetical protein